MRQTFRPGNRSDAEPHENYLGKTRAGIGTAMQPRDQAGHGDVEEAGSCQCKRVGQSPEGPLKPEVRGNAAKDGR